MKDKPVTVFFSAVSLIIWAATISVIVFAVVLLCTGMEKDPVFTLNSAAVQKVDAADPVLAENGKSGEDWCVLRMEMTVSADKYSPFSYTAETFALREPAATAKGAEWFTAVDEPLSYSKIEPDDYTLNLYIRAPQGAEALAEEARSFGFGMRGLVGHFTFIRYPFNWGLPGFTLSQFSVPVTVAAD
ncbi:MAG: hypothetical protein IJL25_11025 [Clostridia bacterium]|nr:hypothetical protein [Clostridia bacterium]MBR5424844.1 hypothetical protein [Clostridia bacterium]